MEYTFVFSSPQGGHTMSLWGSDVLQEDAPAYTALDCANDFIDKFKAYYELAHRKTIPRPHLFVINNNGVNAFARYERPLSEYCIGIFYGVFDRIRHYTETIVDMVITQSRYIPWHKPLIPKDERDRWVDFVYINAIRFFIAHEYAHILCGHLSPTDTAHMEFADETLSQDDSMFKQMKEFDADETAMSMLCFMVRCHFETRFRRQQAMINKALNQNSRRLADLGIPEALINWDAQRFIDGLRRAHTDRVDNVRRHLKYLMLGVNIVFLVLDENRAAHLRCLAEQQHIPAEEQKTFYFTSGLRLIRCLDHPLAALRLDAVIRIMDEYIEAIEGIEHAETICDEVADYVWDVEFLRCERRAESLSLHIAHTPTAQNFIQEIEALWQREKSRFPALITPMERLFYENRIIDMSDDGALIIRRS